jgi:hypothetical protein
MSGPVVIGFAPVKAVHQLAFMHLRIAQMTLWMKGYTDMNVISHSWGTTLAYDMMNSGGIEMQHWVTMGSPLNSTVRKPVWNEGKWINAYSTRDPVVYLDMYPNSLVNGFPILLPRWGAGLTAHPQVDAPPIITAAPGRLPYSLGEHTTYWTHTSVLSGLRTRMQ